MRRRELARGLAVTIALTVTFAIGQVYPPVVQPSDLQTAALQAPAAQPAPSPQPAPAPGPGAGHASPRPGPSAGGAAVNPHRLPVALPEARQRPARDVDRHFPVGKASFEQLKERANQAAAAAAEHRPEGPPGRAAGPAFPTLDRNQSSNGGDNSLWNPPDGALAVGPGDAVLVAVNQSFAIYSRDGVLQVGPIGFNTFFGTSGSTFDPRALYDAGKGRFVLLATTGAEYALAVSQNDSPQGPATSWCVYRLNAVIDSASGPTYADFPGLGLDGDSLYITSNQFSAGDVFQSARLLIVPKATVYPDAVSGACPTSASTDFRDLHNPGGGASFTVQPAHQPDALPGQTSAMYLVNAIWPEGLNLAVRRVTRAADGTPLLEDPSWVSSGFIAGYTLPADAPQPGGGAIDTFDTRLLGAVHRYGKLYTANTTRTVDRRLAPVANPYANVQWYTITPPPTESVGASAAVTNRNVAYFIPAVLPGCAAAGGTCSNPFVGLEVTGSGRSQPASAFSVRATSGSSVTVTQYQQGVAGYTLNGRWGDYPAVAADPLNAGAVWVLGEYAKATDAWGTAVGKIQP
jgi:hypothetical protein